MRLQGTTHSKRPLLRGHIHLVAAVIAPFALIWLLLSAHSPASYVGAAAFGAGLIGLFGVSASYHVGAWHTRYRDLFQRLDHSMIFLAVAAFYTPFCLQVIEPSWRIPALALVWAVAIAGSLSRQFGLRPKGRWAVLPYLGAGWLALALLPALLPHLELPTLAALLAAGVVFTLGALVFAANRPNPLPHFFGHHEVFHSLVTFGCAILYVVVLLDVLPRE